ncbi:hypothetical protein AKG07_01350 [Microbacterium sp. CGR1]|uniref:DUF4012 domain-containing protein n=1 Tax=unclassified Microbacterium TaxID=2609290 RepID=UPI00069D730F|nr:MULTISPECIES: DUF4012 domain-containing protein [unclassified Microbacterium]AKV85162.1 hypothetical protein AKG07_01350 [Microbacterium sp. CGR1]KRD51714.1 hypothetical protein ASE34_07155 [Microbacterium sp. Root280D1]
MSDGRLPVRRRWLRWTIGAIVTLVVLAIGWVGIRGIGAVNDLQQVSAASSKLKQAIGQGDLDTAATLSARIAHHARSAHDLTSDPIWSGFGLLPWLGPNFSAVSDVAEIADDVASDALVPVLAAAEELDLASLGLSGGVVDLTPFAQIEPPLAEASATLTSAETRALDIDAGATIPPLADAVREMRSAVTQAATVVGALHGASALLPSMLGGEGPRNYVLAMQNNAELRSSGGIIGAIALLHAENGRITLVQQASVPDFPSLDTPLPLSESTVALFEDSPGRYMQNLTSIPDFTEAGPAIAARWQNRFGHPIDGVIAVDAVMTENLVAATGPLTFGPFSATKDTVVGLLISEIYASVPDPAAQDEIFSQAAGALLSAALTEAAPKDLVAALAESADEGRIRIWSAHEDEEAILSASTLGGALPEDGPQTHVGVLFNDTTGGKMDFYADAAITTSIGTCDGEPTTQVTVTWKNDAPADAGTALPPYVTANGFYGVPAGSTRTLITVYGPEGATPSHIDRDGEEVSVQTALLGSRSAVQHEVLLAPGESSTITVEYQGTGAGERLTVVDHTPMVTAPDVSREQLRCAS